MSTFTIPNRDGLIRQVNDGETFGELSASHNIDLTSKRGKMKVSKRLKGYISEGKMDNDDVFGLTVFQGQIVAIGSGSRVIRIPAERNPRLSGNWTSSAPSSLNTSTLTDITVFNGALLVSSSTNINRSTDVASYDDDWWTTVVSGTALSSSFPHVLESLAAGQETLFVTDGSNIRYYNATAGHSTVAIKPGQVGCCLASGDASMWVGTYSEDGHAMVYEIYVGDQLNGAPVARNAYLIPNTNAVLGIGVIDSIPYIITDKGFIMQFKGRGFTTVQQFPFALEYKSIDGIEVGNVTSESIQRAIHPKGTVANNRSILININTSNQLIDTLASNPTDSDDVFNDVIVSERSPSGVWEFDVDTKSLSHRYSFSAVDSDKGYWRHLSSGPLLCTNNQYTPIMAAGRIVSNKTDIYMEDITGTPQGYIVTPEIVSDTIAEAWEKIVAKYDMSVTDSIEAKYRTSYQKPVHMTATWVSANTFTTLDDTTGMAVGHEVTILTGLGAGKMAHITSITGGTTKTIELDTDISANAETGFVMANNWTKINGTITGTNINFGTIGVTSAALPAVQFKIVFNGEITVRQLIFKGNAKQEL